MSILFFYEKCFLFLVKLTSCKFEIPLRTVVLSLNLASLIFVSFYLKNGDFNPQFTGNYREN